MQRRSNFLHCLVPLCRFLGHHLENDGVQFGCDVWIDHRRRHGLLCQVLFQQFVRRKPGEWQRPGQHFEERYTQTVEVRSHVRWLFQDSLRRNVVPRPLDYLLAGKHLPESALDPRRQRKVDDFCFTRLVDHNVVGLNIAVQPALLMHKVQSSTEFFAHFSKVRLQSRQPAGQMRLQTWEARKVHRKVAVIPINFDLVKSHKARVFQRLPNLELVLQSIFFLGILQALLQQQLHRQLQ